MKAALRLPTRWATTSGRLGSPVRNPGKTIQTPNKSPTHFSRSEEHTSELQSLTNLVCRLLLEKNNCAARTPPLSRELLQEPPLPAPAGAGLRAIETAPQRRLVPGPPAPMTPPELFFFNDTATTEIYTLSLHDALPI